MMWNYTDVFSEGWIVLENESYIDVISVYSGRKGFVIFGSVLAAWIVLANIILSVALLSSKSLYSRPSGILLLNLCVADLLVGVIVVPFAVYYEKEGRWRLGEPACRFWVLMDILVCCGSVFALIAINLDRLIYIINPVRYSRYGVKPAFALVAATWILSALIVVPMNLLEGDTEIMEMNICAVGVNSTYNTVLSSLIFFAPAFILICLTVAIFYQLTRMRYSFPQTGSGAANMREYIRKGQVSAIACCLVNSAFIIMWAPFYTMNIVAPLCEYNCVGIWWQIFIWIGYSNSAINPLLWVLYKDIRERLKALVCCKLFPAVATSKSDIGDQPVTTSTTKLHEMDSV